MVKKCKQCKVVNQTDGYCDICMNNLVDKIVHKCQTDYSTQDPTQDSSKINEKILKDPEWFPNGTLYYPKDDPFKHLLHRCDKDNLGIVVDREPDPICSNCGYGVPDTGFSQLHGANLHCAYPGLSLIYKVHHNLSEGTDVTVIKGRATVETMGQLVREGKVERVLVGMPLQTDLMEKAYYRFIKG